MASVEKRTNPRTMMPTVFVSLAVIAILVILTGFIFVHAHRQGWTLGWIYLGTMVATLAVNLACLLRWNPELIRRRMRHSKFAKKWDKVWAALFAPAIIAVFVAAAIEAKGRVASTPGAAWLLGLVIFVLGWALANWSMVVNPFFEQRVRIQREHGHRVIDTGPYAYVRHPGYVGFSGWIFSTPLLLASTWALLPALITVVLFVIRTMLEDRMLQTELPGYAAYATRVRYRLIPGVW